MLPPPKRLREIIRDAMPARMRASLRESGQLEKVIEDRATQAEDSYQAAMSRVTDRASSASRNLTHSEMVSEMYQGRSEAAREALNQAVEFALEADVEDTESEATESGAEPLSQVLYWNENSGGKTDVTLTLKPDGSLELFYYDIGPASKKMWGDSDYESWVTIPAEAVPQLAFSLLAEKYRDRFDSVTDLRKFCENHSIAHADLNWA